MIIWKQFNMRQLHQRHPDNRLERWHYIFIVQLYPENINKKDTHMANLTV
jgi:hypothetical protein